MMHPTIHLNGTSKEHLYEQYESAYNALGAAYQTLKQAAPHGRDYYPQGPGATEQAMKEHMARLQRIDDVMKELGELLEHIVS